MMCGSGVKENLLPVIQKKNLEKKIKVFENRDDIPRFLQTLDCYFFPSITEGQPNALIEAMIIGIPSIASNIPSIKETTPSEIHSYLKDPLDAERSEEHTSELQSRGHIVCRLLLEKK